MCNDHATINIIKKLCQQIVIEQGDGSEVEVSHHRVVNIPQEYEVDPLYMFSFWLHLNSIKQLDTVVYASTSVCSKCSSLFPSSAVTSNQVNIVYIVSPATVLNSTVPSISTQSTLKRIKKRRDRISSSTHTTLPLIIHCTKPTPISHHTDSPCAASTIPPCLSATKYPKPTWKPLTISET